MPGALRQWARAGLAWLAVLMLALAPGPGSAMPVPQTPHAAQSDMPCHDGAADAVAGAAQAPSGLDARAWAACCNPAASATLPAPLPWGVPLGRVRAVLANGVHQGKPGIAPPPTPPPPRQVPQLA